MVLVALFKLPRDREIVAQPRDAWQCSSCGWVNVFRPSSADTPRVWRNAELKRMA